MAHRPLLVDLTIEEGTRLKVIYGSAEGFHAIDLDQSSVYDIYIPKHVQEIQITLYIYKNHKITFEYVFLIDSKFDHPSYHCTVAQLERYADVALL